MKTLFLGLFVGLLSVACESDSNTGTNQKIVGEWQVIAIHNSSPSGPTMGPADGETITVNFVESGTLNGTTASNNFGGEFSLTSNTLRINGLYSTEVAETLYGIAFFEAFTNGMNADNQFSEFELSFQDNEQLNLMYQNFKFLTLQKQ